MLLFMNESNMFKLRGSVLTKKSVGRNRPTLGSHHCAAESNVAIAGTDRSVTGGGGRLLRRAWPRVRGGHRAALGRLCLASAGAVGTGREVVTQPRRRWGVGVGGPVSQEFPAELLGRAWEGFVTLVRDNVSCQRKC